MDQFRIVLLKRGCKASTIRRHVWNVKHLLRDTKFTKKDIDKYFLSLLESGHKESYINSLIDSMRVYAQWKKLPITLQNYKYFKERPTEKATLSDSEIEAFLNLPPLCKKGAGHVSYNRWTMFFRLLAYTGARPGEIAKLTKEDIDWGNNCIHVNDDKTRHNRLLPIADCLKEPILTYLNALPGEELFAAHNRTGFFNSVQWHYQFQTRIKRLDIHRNHLSCYSLRHSFGTSLANEDVDIRKIMKIMGHSRLDTTLVYTHLATKDIHNALKKHPLVRKTSDPHYILKLISEFFNGLELEKDERFDCKQESSNNKLLLEVEIKS